MAPHFSSGASPSTILIPRDTPSDDPSTTKLPDKGPSAATALHIVLGFVLVGVFISLLAWMKHKFSNPSMARHPRMGANPRTTLSFPPSHDSVSTSHGVPDRYSSPPPIPHPRRGIKESHPPPRPIRPPPLVTNEESFKAATPRQEPTASRHDFASSTEPARNGSPVKRRGREGRGRGQSGQLAQFRPFPSLPQFPSQLISPTASTLCPPDLHPTQANPSHLQTHPPAHALPVLAPAPAPAPTFLLALLSILQASAPSADKRRSSSASTRPKASRRRQGQQKPAPTGGSRFLVPWHPSLSRYLCPSVFPVLLPFRFPRRGTVASHECHGIYNR